MKQGFVTAALLAAGLAGCGSVTPVERLNYREIDPNQGLFSETFTWHWVPKNQLPSASGAPAAAAAPVAAPAAAPMTSTEAEEFKKWQESAGTTERREFEEWRAWQEWKKKNPK